MRHSVETPAGPFTIILPADGAVQLTDGKYERVTWDFLCQHVKSGDRVVDIGAHHGMFTCLLAKLVGPTGHVDAFEPHPQNRTKLISNLRANGLSWVKVHKTACSNTCGKAPFYWNADNDGGHAIYDVGRLPGNNQSRQSPRISLVEQVKLDDVVTGPIACIKMDTEGAEFAVCQGAQSILTRDKPVVVAEVNGPGLNAMGTNENDWRTWMRGLGYSETALIEPDARPIAADETCSTAYQWGQWCIPVWNVGFTPAHSG